MEEIEPTVEEARNGWTAESLTAYFREREQAQAAVIADAPQFRPDRANGRYSPHRWRR